MIAKSLSRRLQRLEARSILSATPVVLVVNFVDADRQVVSRIQLTSEGITPIAISGREDEDERRE